MKITKLYLLGTITLLTLNVYGSDQQRQAKKNYKNAREELEIAQETLNIVRKGYDNAAVLAENLRQQVIKYEQKQQIAQRDVDFSTNQIRRLEQDLQANKHSVEIRDKLQKAQTRLKKEQEALEKVNAKLLDLNTQFRTFADRDHRYSNKLSTHIDQTKLHTSNVNKAREQLKNEGRMA